MKQSPQNIPFFASKMCIPLFYWVGWGGSHACHSAHVEIRGQATGVGPFLLQLGLSAASSYTHLCPQAGLPYSLFIWTLKTETELRYRCCISSIYFQGMIEFTRTIIVHI